MVLTDAYIAVMVLILVTGIAVFLVALFQKKGSKMLNGLSQRTGLRLIKPHILASAKLEGDYKAYKVFVGTTYEGYGRNRRSYFTIRVESKSVLPPFILAQENFFTRLIKKVGFKEAQIGNPTFDERFFISGEKDAEKLRRVLTSDVQSILLNLRKGFKIVFSSYHMSYKRRAYPDESEAFSILNELIRIMEKTDKGGGI